MIVTVKQTRLSQTYLTRFIRLCFAVSGPLLVKANQGNCLDKKLNLPFFQVLERGHASKNKNKISNKMLLSLTIFLYFTFIKKQIVHFY